MFENLRDAFSSAAKSLGERELKEKDIEDVLFQLEISLLESDVATEVIDSIKFDLTKKLIGTKINKKEIEKFVKDSLIQTISSLFDSAGKIDIFSKITSKRASGQPYIILFVGINGTGKTTTLAKLAYLLQKSKFSVVVAAADTFRAGAIEQLKEHTSRLNLKIVAQTYGSDPAAVARDAVLYAKSHKIDCVLVDTAGRMQTSKNLMDQIAKIINVVKPDFKIFVGDSLAGNDTVNQAKEFHKHTKFDAAILTKSDADARGGAALSIVKVTSTPVLYVGVGQEYKDLKTFDKELFLETVFGKHDESEISITKEKVHETESKIDSKQVEETIPESQAIEESSRESQITEEYDEIKPSKDSDPFEGLDTKDINLYADLFDAPPPENDQQAQELSVKIKKWISNGRPKPYDNSKEVDTQKMKDDSEKPKKKHSLFGRFKK
ncbi:MAG: signal recognition particle-docking protein FtsY [Thaumarchaeota archaeon CSP1-1]|nr:MAG: signal recognition particle-docking protein FtsY [Thaumarchaeota archaeon CSP1-1]